MSVDFYNYNPQGLLISKTHKFTNSSNDNFNKDSYEYKNAFLTRSVYGDNDFEIISYSTILNSDKMFVEINDYMSWGELNSKKTFNFIANNNTILITVKDLINDFEFMSLLKFDSGLLTYVDKEYSKDEEITKYYFEYEDKDNLISSREFYNEKLIKEKTYKYKFDKSKNWIEQIEFENLKPKYLRERIIEYY